MSFSIPKYSKSQISKAGSDLADLSVTNELRANASEILNHWRACHAYPINTFQATLRQRLKKISKNALVAQRLKRTPSIIKKLQINPNMQLARMQDIGGLRAVVDSMNQVNKIRDVYINRSFEHELIKENNYIENPKKSGYRSLHLIYKYKNSDNTIYDGLYLELQIRTKLQHIWATAVETVGTFSNQALKSNEGEKSWLNYFKLISAAFSRIEKTKSHADFIHLSDIEIYKLVKIENDKLEIKNKLRGYTLAVNLIDKNNNSGNYHIVILDFLDRRVKVESYGKKNLEKANQRYAEYELAAEIDKKTQVVLVSTTSTKALKRAYPNYFLDTNDFVRQLNFIEKLLLN